RKLVRIEQHAGGAVQSVSDIEHALILQAVVARVKVLTAAHPRQTEAFEVPQLFESIAQLLPLRQILQVTEGDFVLRLDPSLGWFAVELFEPAIRICNLLA